MKTRSSRLELLSFFLVGCVFFLLMAGGLVTSHEAGLAVPDWPLSYGTWMPPMVGNIFWEHGHRMIAGFVALLTLFTAVCVQRSGEPAWIKKLAWAGLVMVILQALLGGMTVLMLLPPPVSISHACLGQTFFCLTIALAYYLNPASRAPVLSGEAPEHVRKLQRLTLLTFLFVYLQLILGAVVRHSGKAVYEHMGFALAVIAHVVLVQLSVSKLKAQQTPLRPASAALAALTLVQIFLGIGAFLYTRILPREGDVPPLPEVVFASAHHTNGALVIGLAALLFIMVRPAPFWAAKTRAGA